MSSYITVSGLGLVSYGAVDEEESDPEGGKHSGDEAEDKSPFSVHSNNKVLKLNSIDISHSSNNLYESI